MEGEGDGRKKVELPWRGLFLYVNAEDAMQELWSKRSKRKLCDGKERVGGEKKSDASRKAVPRSQKSTRVLFSKKGWWNLCRLGRASPWVWPLSLVGWRWTDGLTARDLGCARPSQGGAVGVARRVLTETDRFSTNRR